MPTLFADVTFSTEGIVVISALLTAVVGAMVVVFKLLIKSKDDQIHALESRCKSYEEMYAEAINALEIGVNTKRRDEGKQPFRPMAAVVPEHNSPVTEEQQKTADLQTDRARLTAAVLALGLPAREPGVSVPSTSDVGKLKDAIVEAKTALIEAPNKIAEKTAEIVMEKLAEKEKGG